MKFHRKSQPSRKNARRQKKQRSLRSNLHAPDSLSRLSILRHEKLEDRTLLTATYYVDNTPTIGGPGADQFTPNGGTQTPVNGLTLGTNLFTTISAAVAAASNGDTIDVADGTYSEQVNVNKSLTIQGNQFGSDARTRLGINESILDASGDSGHTPFTISANDVTIDGFTVENQTNANIFNTAIYIAPGHHGTHVVNDIVTNNMVGLFLANDSADQAVVQHDLFDSNNQPGPAGGNGIYLDQYTSGAVQNVLIDSNTFTNNDNGGIIFGSTDNTQPTTNATVSNNDFNGNGLGLYLYNTTGSNITGNTITDSAGSGIKFAGGDSNDTVTANAITGNNTSSAYVAAGIEVGDIYVLSGVGPNSNLTINYNNIDSQANGGYNLEVDPYPHTASSNPNVVGPSYTGGANSLDATNNFWGVTTPAAVAATILDPLGQVNYTPFLGGGAAVLTVVAGQPELIEPDGTIVAPPPASYTNNTGSPVTFVIDYSNGDPTPGGFTFTGQAGDTDSLLVTGYSGGTVTDTYTGPNSGTVQVDGNGLITYANLSPHTLTLSGTAADLIIDLSQTGVQNPDVVVGASGAAGFDQISGSTFVTTPFANPSNSLTIDLGPDGDTITTQDMDAVFAPAGAGKVDPFLINGGSGGDTFDIQSTQDAGGGTYGTAAVGLGIVGNSTSTVNVGNGTNGVQSIGSTLNIENPPALNTIAVDDSADTTAHTVTLSTFTPAVDEDNPGGTNIDPYGQINGLAPANINYEYFDTTSLAISGDSSLSADTYNVQATGATTYLSLNTSIFATSTVNVGNATNGVQSIASDLYIDNPSSFANVVVDDKADTTNHTVTLSTFTPGTDGDHLGGGNLDPYGKISGLAPADINYEYANTNSVAVKGDTSTSADTYNVQATGVTTYLSLNTTLPAHSTVNVGNAGSVQSIAADLYIDSVPGLNNVVVDDSADTTARTVTLSNVTPGTDGDHLGGGNTEPYGQISGLAAAATINYEYYDTHDVTIDAGTDAGAVSNIFNVNATGQAGPNGHIAGTTTVNAGNNGDTFNIADSGLFAANVMNGGSGDDSFVVTGALTAPATLNIDGGTGANSLSVPSGDVVTPNGLNSGTVGTDNAHPANVVSGYANIQNVMGGPYTLNIDTTNFPGIPSGSPDTEKLVVSGTQLQFYLNGTLEGSYTYASLTAVNVTGSSDNDTLTVDFSGGDPVPSGGINFDGATGASNQLIVTGYTGVAVDSVYTGPHTGNVTVGAAAAITYKDLSPLFLTGTATDLIIDLTQTGVANPDVLVKASGTAGEDQISGSTFETTTFTNPGNSLTINLGPHGDTITTQDMDAAFAPTGTGKIDPFIINGGGGGDTYDVQSTEDAGGGAYGTATAGLGIVGAAPAITSTVNVGNGTNGVQSIKSTLNIENPFAFNTITVDDSADTTGRTATLSTLGTNPADSDGNADPWGQIVGLSPANINYEYPDTNGLTVDGGTGSNSFYVQATGIATTINTGSGNDTVDVSSDAPTDTGNLAGIAGPLNVNSGAGTDTMNVSDLGGAAGTTYTLSTAAGATTLSATGVANITYDANGTAGQLENFNLVGSTAGGNTYNIGLTSATVSNTITDGNAAGTGGSTFNIQANMLQGGATNTFNGNENSNTFNANYAADTSTSAVAGTTFVINAGATPGTSAARNVVNVDTTADTVARNLGFTYPSAVGGYVNITGLGTDPLGLGVQITAAQEVNSFGGAGNVDTATVKGLGTGSVISVTPTTANAADVFLNGTPEILTPTSSANNPGVFGGGGAPDLYLNGLAQAAGLTVNGGGGTAQLVVNATTEDSGGLAGTSGWAGFQMSTGNYLGGGTFTPSTIRAAGNAYDTIGVSDSAVSIFNNSVGNLLQTNVATATFGNPSATNPALTVNSGDELGVQPNGIADDVTVTLSPTLAILVNGGNPTAAVPGPLNGVPRGDQLNVLTPAEADIYSDDANPPHVSVNSLTQGTQPVSYTSIERLNVKPGNGIVNLIGDDNVPGKAQNDYFKVRGGPDLLNFPLPTNGVGQFSLQIGGDWNPATNGPNKDFNATPIYFSGVTRINAGGGAATGFDANGNATFDSADPAGTNALDITPYADNTPVGWGIATYWYQGNKVPDGGYPDLLTYNGVSGVSENITIQPSENSLGVTGPAGQVIDNNAATGTPIAVVNYTFNTNIVVNASSPAGTAGDTDSLTLMGTDPGSAGTSGNEDFLANFTATGTPTTPMVRVYDAGAGALSGRTATAAESTDTAGTAAALTHLYNLQSFSNFSTINFATGDGNDLVDLVAGLANGSLGVNVNTGATGQSTTIEADGTPAGNNIFLVTPGASNDTGSLSFRAIPPATAATIVNFGHTQSISLVGGGAADDLTLYGTQSNDTFVLTATGAGAGNAKVSAGPLVNFSNFGNLSRINLNDPFAVTGMGGSDTFIVNQASGWAIPDVVAQGNGNDTFELIGRNAADAFTYTPISASAGNLIDAGGTTTTYHLLGIGAVSLDGTSLVGNSLTFGVPVGGDTYSITPGSDSNSGTITVSNSGNNLLPISYKRIQTVTPDTTNTAVVGAPAGGSIVVDGTGVVTVKDASGVTVNTYNFSGDTGAAFTLDLNLLAGNIAVTIDQNTTLANLYAGGINVIGGGPSANGDTLTVNSTVAATNTILDFLANTIANIVTGNISFFGVANLILNGAGDGASTFTVNNYGDPTNVTSLTLNSNDGLGGTDKIAVSTTTAATSTLDFAPGALGGGPGTATLTRTEGGPAINISNFNTNIGKLTLSNTGGFSAVHLIAPNGPIGVNVSNTATGDTLVQETDGAASLIPFEMIENGAPSFWGALVVDGGQSNVALTVDNSNGLVTADSALPPHGPGIIFNGGAGGNNSLTLTGTTAVTSDVYTPGPGTGQGRDVQSLGAATQIVTFNNLTPVTDNVTTTAAGQFVVQGTTGNDAITIANNNISANNLESITFANKFDLTVNGNGGNDTFNVSPAGITLGGGGITVNGAAGASDSLTVNGTAAIGYNPTGPGAGNVTTTGKPTVFFTNLASAAIVGDLSVTTPTGIDHLTLTPGDSFDSATLTDWNATLGTLVPLTFSSLGVGSSLTLKDFSGGPVDSLTYNGTAANDTFTVDAGTGTIHLNSQIPVLTPGIADLTLNDVAGENTYTIGATAGNPQPYTTINVNGSGLSDPDVVTLSGDGASAVTVTMNADGTATASGGGLGTVDITGVATVNVSNAGNTVNVDDAGPNNTLVVTPTGATADSAQLAGSNQMINVTSAATFNANLTGTNDSLTVDGTPLADTLTVSGTLVTEMNASFTNTVNYTGAKALQVNGEAGSDTFNVTPAAIPISIDGGDPVGVLPGDTLNIVNGGQPVSYFAGPTNDSGGFLVGANAAVSFIHIETIGPITNPGNLAINGTNGDDDITVIARDHSYDPAYAGPGTLDGQQDFTVSVNSGPEILFVDATSLTVNALSGDDDIVLQAPAPNGAVWNEPVTINGGAPSTLGGRLGDTFSFETPAGSPTQTVSYTPNGPNSGAFNDTTITSMITVNDVEQLFYNGGAAGDALTVTSAALSHIVYTPGATTDAGTAAFGSNLPLSFTNLGAGTVNLTGGAGSSLTYNGTAANDTFGVSATGAVTLNSQLAVTTAGVSTLTLNGLAGDNTYTIAGAATLPYTTINVNGSGLSDPDVLNLNGDGTSPVVVHNLGGPNPSVTGGDLGTVDITGVGTVNITNGSLPNGSILITGTANGDSFNVTPTSATTAAIQADGVSPVVNATVDVGAGDTLVVDPASGSNSVTINGTAGNETITTALGAITTNVTVAGLLPIGVFSPDTQSLVLSGGAGTDTYSFTGTGGPGSITVVGGSGTNFIDLPGVAATNDTYIVSPGTNNASGTVSYLLGLAASPSIAFSGVQNIVVAGDGTTGSDTLSMFGTAGNDIFNLLGTGSHAGSAQVNGGPLVTFNAFGTGGSAIDLFGDGGADTFNVTQPGNWQVANVTVAGGTPGAGGNLLLNAEGTAGTDAFTYTSTGPQTGTVGLTSVGSMTTYTLTNVATLGVNELGPAAASLTVNNANAVITPSTTPGSGTVTTTDVTNSFALLPLSYTNVFGTVSASGNSVVINAPDDGDIVTVNAGVVSVKNPLGVTNTIDVHTYGSLAIDLQGANDVVNFTGSNAAFFAGLAGGPGVTIVGGVNGYTVNAPVTAASTLTVAQNSTFSGVAAGNVMLEGIANLKLTGNLATVMTVTGYGTPSTLASVTLDSDATIGVTTSGTLNTFDYTSKSPTSAQFAIAGGGPTINITTFNNVPGNLTLTGSAVNALDVIGSAGINQFNVSLAGLLSPFTRVKQTTGGVWVPLDFTGLRSLTIGGGNSDTLTVDDLNGAVTTPIFYNGGSGASSLVLTSSLAGNALPAGNTLTSDSYAPGPATGQGTDTMVITGPNGGTQVVAFTNLTPVTDNVPGPLTVNGTTGNDAITAGATANVVTVNNLESFTFSNKLSLTLDGNGGNDTFLVSPSSITLTGTGAITVNGAVGAVDTVTVNATGNIGYNPTGAAAGNITSTGNSTVFFVNVGAAAINGEGGQDNLTYQTPANGIGSELTYTPGANPDGGMVAGDQFGVLTDLAPLTFSNLGTFGTVNFTTANAGRTDHLNINGSGGNDIFNVGNSGPNSIQILKNQPTNIWTTLPMTSTGADVLELRGLAPDDQFNLTGGLPYTDTIVDGDPSVVDLSGATGAVTVNLANSTTSPPTSATVTGFGGTITLNGVDVTNVNAGGNTLTVNGTPGNDTISATPTGTNSVSFQSYSGGSAQNGQGGTLASLTAISPAFNATNVSVAAGGFSINGNGGSDMLFVEGTQNADTIDVNDAASGANAVKVGGALTVNYNAAMAQVEVDALAGSDTINIQPSTTTTFLVDGGDPIGVQPGDTINLIHPAGQAYQIYPGPTSDSGGLKTQGGYQTVSWVHIESIVNSGPGGPAIITGTNGNDEITVIARDSSYNPASPGTPNPLLDGIQDFTVSVNGGPDMLFVNQPTLFIDSLSGNDDIVVEEPAPNQANWNVQVYVAAGAPASGANRLGDNIELETPGTHSVTYNPNNPLASVPPVAGVTFSTPTEGGGQFGDTADTSTVTAAQFLFPLFYQSSSGGAENFIYAGQAPGDTLTYNTPANGNAGSNLVYTPGATPDAGTIDGSLSGGAALTPLTFSGLGTTGTVAFTTSNAGRTDHLNVEGVPTAAGESFSVTPAGGGTVQLSQLPPASGIVTVPITTASVSSLELDGLGGNDQFNLSGALPYTNTIVDDGATVNLTGATGAVAVNLANSATSTNATVTGYGGTVTLVGVDTANLNAFLIAGFGAVTVNGTTADDSLAVTPTGPNSATAQGNGAGTVYNFTNAASFTTDLMGGNNTLVVNGSAAADAITAINNAPNPTVTVQSGVNPADLPIAYVAADLSALDINGLDGNDTLTVNSGGANGPITTPIFYDGGTGSNSLTLTGGTTLAAPGSDTYTPGPATGQGKDVLNFAAGTETVHFANLAPVLDLVAGPLTVDGTTGNDAITAGPSAGNQGVVTVNNLESITYNNKTSLTLNGLAGNDSFDISPVGMTLNAGGAITVKGAAGTTDSVTVNGTAAGIGYLPTAAGAGEVTTAGPNVFFTSIASAAINGDAGGDTLTYTSPAGGGNLQYAPGASPDAGTINGHAFAAFQLTPLSFTNLGVGGAVTFNNAGGHVDTLDLFGTQSTQDDFVATGAADQVQILKADDPTIFRTVVINTPGIDDLVLHGLGSGDTFNLSGPLPYTSTYVDSGDPATVDLTGATGAVTVNLADTATSPPTPTTITGYGGTVTLGGVDVANLDAGTNAVVVNGSATHSDSLAVTPTGPSAATAQDNGSGTVFNFANATSFNTDLGGGTNTLTVNGSAASDSITAQTNVVGNPTVTVNADLPIGYAAGHLAALDINGLDGNDVLTVDATHGAVTPAITYDGGTGTNALQLKAGGAAGNVATSDIYTPGSQLGSGTDSLNFTVGGAELVHFLNLAPIFDFVAGPLTVNGTNAANQINYSEGFNSLANFLAVVPSTTWGQVSVDSYEPIEFINKTSLQINALAGSDTINLNNPNTPTGLGPALTSIVVDGGDPTAGSDTLNVNGTVATDAITYTPTGTASGTFAGAGPVGITFGNIEHLYLNGQGGNDNVTIVGTGAGGDTFVHTPGAVNDSGNVALNTWLALNYQNLGTTTPPAAIIVSDTGVNNTLVVQGTGNNDAFTVAGTPAGTISLNSRVQISQVPASIANLVLNGVSASDTFTLNATMPYTSVAVNGANIANNDAVVLQGATGPITVNLGNVNATPPTLTTINGYNGALATDLVSLSDIAQASINGSGADTLKVNGTPNDDQINYTPTLLGGLPEGGNFNLTGLNTAFTFNIGTAVGNTFTINGGGYTGGDQVNVYGPNSGSTFVTDEVARTVTVSNAAGTALKPVILGSVGTNDVNVANLMAGIGNNTFLVAPAPAVLLPGKSALVGAANFQVPNDLLVNVVGGGATSQNALVVGTVAGGMLDASLFAAVMRNTTTSGVIRMYKDSGGAEPIQWPDITYTGVATLQTNTFDPAGDTTGTNQQTLVMGPDGYEPDQTLATAAYLGSGAAINVSNLAIFPNAQELKFVNPDNDWYRVVAQYTGTLDFQVYFKQQFFAQNGHPLDAALPGAGELSVDVYDANSNLIANFGVNDSNSDQRRRIPVVAGETYYFKVFGQDPSGLGTNGYNMSIVNTPTPAPDSLGLNNIVAQGLVSNAAAPTTTTITANSAPVPAPVIPPNFQTQPLPPLSTIDNFYVGMYLEFTNGPLVGQRQLISSYVAATRTFTFASAFTQAPTVTETFQIESDDTGRSQLDNITRDNLPTVYIRLALANTNPLNAAPFYDALQDLAGGGSAMGNTFTGVIGNNGNGNPPNNAPILIPFWPGNAASAPLVAPGDPNNGSYRVALFDDTNPNQEIFLGYANIVPNQPGVFQLKLTTPLADGVHNLVAKIQIDSPSETAGHAAAMQTFNYGPATQLQIVIDTIAPPVYFGSPTVPKTGLLGSSDTGVNGQPATIVDRITADSTPTLYGVAEANDIVKLYVDMNGNGKVDNGDILLGQTTATPIDGTNQDPNGQWSITSNIDLNDPRYGFPLDGLRNLLVTAEDVAGNVSPAQQLQIFVDTEGPTIGNIGINGNPAFPLFATKLTAATTPSPTPLVNAIDITFNDLPIRVGPDFVYPAVNPILAETTANYFLVGEHTGVVPVISVTFADSTVAGSQGMSVATLHFAAPLPDDRYTLTVSDKITDNAGNALDGEFNGTSFPTGLPSGNTNRGVSFVGAFTVNSRPDIGVYSSGTVSLDINGNGVFDPQNSDANNRDAIVTMGYPTDRLFSGQFSSTYGTGAAPVVSGFDKLASYGVDSNGNYRWLYDLSGISAGPPTSIPEPFPIDGLPVAGNFDGSPLIKTPNRPPVATTGQQVGLFDGTAWYLDVLDQGFISAADIATPATATHPAGKMVSNMAGLPVAGDFDGDGHVDLATYQDGVFEFDLSSLEPNHIVTGQWNEKLNLEILFPSSIPFNTVTARPVAADIDADGQTDIGLYVPERTDNNPGTAQWYFIGSNFGATPANALGALSTPLPAGNKFLNLVHQYEDPSLGGHDLSYDFGDQFGLPVIGTFDPPNLLANSNPSGGVTASTVADWISRLYVQVLGREPSIGELDFWVQQSQSGMTTSQIGQLFAAGSEYIATQINDLYVQYLGRSADASGLAYWSGIWNATGGPEHVQAGIIGSPEFYATAGKIYSNLSADAAWVTALYHDILNRDFDPNGLGYWTTLLQTNSRASIVLGFVTSEEYRMDFINNLFETYLGRAADPGAVQALVQAMQAGMTQDQLRTAIVSSAEYINKTT